MSFRRFITKIIVIFSSLLNSFWSKLKYLLVLFVKYTFLDQIIDFNYVITNTKQIRNSFICYINTKSVHYYYIKNNLYSNIINFLQNYNMGILVKNFNFLIIIVIYLLISVFIFIPYFKYFKLFLNVYDAQYTSICFLATISFLLLNYFVMLNILIYFINIFKNNNFIININNIFTDTKTKTIVEDKFQLFLILIKFFLLLSVSILNCIIFYKICIFIKFLVLIVVKLNKTIFNQTEFLVFIVQYQYPNLNFDEVLNKIPHFKLNSPALMIHFMNEHRELFFYFDKFIFYSVSKNFLIGYDYVMFVFFILFLDLMIIFFIVKLILLVKFNKKLLIDDLFNFFHFNYYNMILVFITFILSFILYTLVHILFLLLF